MLWPFFVALHICATLTMNGLALLVHVVHYPLFRHVDPAQFVTFHRTHASRITWLVGPLMLAEVASAIVLAVYYQEPFWWSCVALSTACFALTGILAVPLHNVLARGWDVGAHRRLIKTNIWRTLAWFAHSGLLFLWLLGHLTDS